MFRTETSLKRSAEYQSASSSSDSESSDEESSGSEDCSVEREAKRLKGDTVYSGETTGENAADDSNTQPESAPAPVENSAAQSQPKPDEKNKEPALVKKVVNCTKAFRNYDGGWYVEYVGSNNNELKVSAFFAARDIRCAKIFRKPTRLYVEIAVIEPRSLIEAGNDPFAETTCVYELDMIDGNEPEYELTRSKD